MNPPGAGNTAGVQSAGGVVANTGQEVAHRNGHAAVSTTGVDPEDEPSAAWGWHGGFPRGSVIAGWFTVVAMLIMLIGNHQGHVEDVWLVVIAAVMAFGLVRHNLKQRTSWRR
jgi:hypothetical protein